MSSTVLVCICWKSCGVGVFLESDPRFVQTFELKGGLYHVMFLVRSLLFFGAYSCGGLYVSLWSYALYV